MGMTEHRCNRCGAELTQQSDTRWRCRYCGCTYDDTTAVQNTKNMREMFDDAKQETINNLRRNLYDATNAEYISSADVKNACVELKKYLPDDFRANFFEIAVSHNERKLTSAIRKIDVVEYYEDIENITKFLIKSLQPDFLLELNNLVERAFKLKDLKLYEKYATEISVQAEKVQLGVYETKLPREVFVAYSSKDMSYVSELVEVLEGQGLKCFVAARNLRHGKGSVENYDKALKEAIDHCKSFVFVSTTNSRSFSCDALEIEIPYVQKKDTENAPAEYRNNYAAIPHKYKKPRVEYRVESSKGFNAADEITKEFFDGYEWVLSPDEVAVRIIKQLVATPDTASEAPKKASAAKKKYCVACGTETDVSQKFCSNCGKSEFVDDIGDFIKLKNQKEIEDRRNREQAAGIHMGAKKSKGVAVLLAFFLGIFGVDQFYLGRTKRGVWRIVWTCLSCGIVSGIWSIIDCIRMATGSLSLYPNEDKKTSKAAGLIIAIIVGIVIVVIIAIAINENTSESGYVTNGDDLLSVDTLYSYEGKWEEITISPDGFHADTSDVLDEYETTYPWDIGSGDTYEDVVGEVGAVRYVFSADGTLTISGEGKITSEICKLIGDSHPLITLVVEDGIESIEDGAFQNCDKLQAAYLPKSLRYIGGYAFYGSSSMDLIEAPGLEEIGEFAFSGCGSLTSIEFPCLTEIKGSAFAACESLTYVNLASVVSIGSEAFAYCYALEKLQLPNVERIESGAFRSCQNLKELGEVTKLVYIHEEALVDTPMNTLSDTECIYIGNLLWRAPTAASRVEISAGTTVIASKAFSYSGSVKEVIIPVSVKTIGENAFYNAHNIETVIYMGSSEQWNQIEFGANWDYSAGINSSTGSLYIEYTNGTYDPSLGVADNTNDFTFTTSDGGSTYSVLEYRGSETAVTIPSTYHGAPVTGISANVFNGTSIVEVTIPASVETICSHAFEGAEKLESVNIEEGSNLKTIESYAFSACKKLASFTVPAGVTSIGNNAFNGCTSLQSIEFADGSQLTTIDSNVFRETSLTSISIPDSVTKICEYAFYQLSKLESVTCTETSQLSEIGSWAFGECKSLTSVVLPHR